MERRLGGKLTEDREGTVKVGKMPPSTLPGKEKCANNILEKDTVKDTGLCLQLLAALEALNLL